MASYQQMCNVPDAVNAFIDIHRMSRQLAIDNVLADFMPVFSREHELVDTVNTSNNTIVHSLLYHSYSGKMVVACSH